LITTRPFVKQSSYNYRLFVNGSRRQPIHGSVHMLLMKVFCRVYGNDPRKTAT